MPTRSPSQRLSRVGAPSKEVKVHSMIVLGNQKSRAINAVVGRKSTVNHCPRFRPQRAPIEWSPILNSSASITSIRFTSHIFPPACL